MCGRFLARFWFQVIMLQKRQPKVAERSLGPKAEEIQSVNGLKAKILSEH